MQLRWRKIAISPCLQHHSECDTTTRIITYTDDDGEGCDGEDNDDDKSINDDDDDDAVHIDMVLTKTRTFLQSQFVARRRYTPVSCPHQDRLEQVSCGQVPIAHNNGAGYDVAQLAQL